MHKTQLTIRSAHRLRREVSLCLGVLAIVFQMAMPFAGAFAASLSGAQLPGQSPEIICDSSGRLISIGGNQSSAPAHSAACEFCLVCPFSVTSPLNAPNAVKHTILFAKAPVAWAETPIVASGRNSDYAILPVRAPPSCV